LFAFFKLDFCFFQFHHSTFDWFGVSLHIFICIFSFHEVISISLPKLWAWRVDSGLFFLSFFIFFSFYPSTLSWLRFGLHNLFWLAFHRFILVTWSGLWVWYINPSWLELFFFVFFNWSFFYSFIHQYLVDWILGFIICFDLLFIGLSRSHNSSLWFGRLNRVDLSRFNMFLSKYSFKKILSWKVF
jgi:hypothetical protein